MSDINYVQSVSESAAIPMSSFTVPYRVFDIEIQKTVEEVGGWGAAREGKAGFACGVIYDSEDDCCWLYGPRDQEAFAAALEAPVVIVSYNGLNFDIPAIEGGLNRKLNTRSHFDILDVLVAQVGGRKGLSLENVAQHTLGRGKSGSGALAPVMYQLACAGGEHGAQEMTKLLNYCALDVILTRNLFRFVQSHGMLITPNGPIHLTLPPYFSQLQKRG